MTPSRKRRLLKGAVGPIVGDRFITGHASVRASRDGDQFHYHWAARRCLELLPGGSDLVAVTIEGPSAAEGAGIEAGGEIIDVGFYYGAEDRRTARLVDYTQLKHSTVRVNDPWTGSGLKGTLEGFAKRYLDLVSELSEADVAARFRFHFTTNRPIEATVAATLVDLATGTTARYPATHALLTGYVANYALDVAKFFALFSAEGGEDDLWAQRNLLTQDVRAYLPAADCDAPVQLKELITRKATTEFATNPSIHRNDVLRALGRTEDELTPAPNMIAEPANELPRAQESDILAQLLAARAPLIIHAEGGVGKSVLAARLSRAMPAGSVAILYDCYGNGLYRTSLNARHRPRDALVQIANELAAKGLCHPLIPTSNADAKAYMQAFQHRLQQAAGVLQARTPGASVCLIIDAADNAQMAAEDLSEPRSFVWDLIHTPMPDGIRLAFTCRTHRLERLDPPHNAVRVELRAFSLAETERHLRSAYPDASESEVADFAFLSSDNPRVQALAMSRGLSLADMLSALGPRPMSVDGVLADLLDRAIAKLRGEHGTVEAGRIDRLCEALAVLRPLVPIAVVARLADVSESEVRSLALDLGRPLFVKGGSLHFLDEPAETWFRERFKPDAAGMANLLERLRPLTADSSYAAAVLPELLLQAGRLDELVALALSDDGLPSDPLARRDVELQRLTFALKACLQHDLALPAAKLALKTAGETAGKERQTRLIQENTDLAAVLLPPDRLEEIVARRPFGSDWMGSHHAYDAGLLSGREELVPEASSRLRMALEWFETWAQNQEGPTEPKQEREQVSDADRVELTMGLFRLRGPGAAASFLRRWRPRRVAMVAGKELGRRLLDLGRPDQIDDFADAARNDVWLLLGLASASRALGHQLPAAVLSRLMRLLADRRVLLSEVEDFLHRWEVLEAVVSTAEMSLLADAAPTAQVACMLSRYLPETPPNDMTSRYGTDRTPLLRAYALDAGLRCSSLTLLEVAPEKPRAQLEGGSSYNRDQDTRVFEYEIGGILPWFVLRAEVICGRIPDDLAGAIELARKATARAENHLHDQIASAWQVAAFSWFELLQDAAAAGAALQGSFDAWLTGPNTKLWSDTIIALCRRAAHAEGLSNLSMTLAVKALEALEEGREDAEARLADFTKLARALLKVSPTEAAAVFNRAVALASRIGDENLDRWDAFLQLGRAAADGAQPKARTAHRLSRAAELTYEYVVRDKHFAWDSTVEVLTDLSPASVFAILSRWRDRRFGNRNRLIPLAIDRMVEKSRLPVTAPVALAGLEAHWDRLKDLKAVAASLSDPSARETAMQIQYRYMRVQPYQYDTWTEIAHLGHAHGVIFADIDRLLALTAQPALSPTPVIDASSPGPHAAEHRDPDWEVIFKDVDFADATALMGAYEAVKTYDPPYRFDEFCSQALARAGAGRAPELINAIAAWPDLSLFKLRDLLEALPKPTPARPALRSAIRDAVLAACQREPHKVRRRGWNVPLPFDRLQAEGVFTDADVVTATLEGFAEQVDTLSAGALFQAIDTLASRLSRPEAEDALNYGLDLLDGLLEPADGNGPWRPAVEPPPDVLAALAGYIWAGLGSPFPAERWEFAHAVRDIVELGWRDLLDAILAWAGRDDAGAFSDQGLEFYLWHARQWLAIGLARAAISMPNAMTNAAPLLRAWTGLPHVLIRELAANSLSRLVAVGAIDHASAVDPAAVNRPAQPVRSVIRWAGTDLAEVDAAQEPSSDEETYHFGIDIAHYWFKFLADAFGVTQGTVERRARGVVRDHLKWNSGDRRDDARLTRKIFRGDETHHSHGSMPRGDDMRAYHGYHAMMIVAAYLLETRAVRHFVGYEFNEFEKWLDGYRLARGDGTWLADRRDPRPMLDPVQTGQENTSTWRWDVNRAYLNDQLMADDGARVVWGHWRRQWNEQTETVDVRSAFVPTAAAESLLAALQTAEELDRYVLPDADHETDIDDGTHQCTGWIRDNGPSARLDEYDPWSEGMRFPGPTPSEEVIAAMGLHRSDDGRAFQCADGGLLRAETWTQSLSLRRDSDIVPGWRLSANTDFLEELFKARPNDRLLLSIEVNRKSALYGSEMTDFEEYAWPYRLYVLLGPKGVVHA
ncbi:hypothetical protein [Phenylobacterium sp.]|uniref:hypothetical protein n=1 Tax=Phenylobacterium sp. TaxID=1871053 RepID=UPI0025F9D6DD|nr:hypothetical protein [Phenylobacterium sp.]